MDHPTPSRFVGLLAITTGVLIAVAAAPAVPMMPGTPTRAPGIFAATGSGGTRAPVAVGNMQGAWFMPTLADGSITPVVARFAADGTFVLGGVTEDPGGSGADDSWATGDFQTRPTGVTFHPTGGWCGATQNFSWHVEIDTEGRLEAVHLGSNGIDRNKIGRCTVLVGATFALSRVSPQSPAGAAATGEYLRPDRPVRENDRRNGYWLVAGTGLLMHISGSAYVMDDAGELGDDALDAGTVTVTAGRLGLVSGPNSAHCRPGNELTISNARIEAGLLQGTAAGDNCSRGLHGPIALLHLDATRP